MVWAQAISPKSQVHFLQRLQQLLSEGSFVASYKFALLHALADLAVRRGDDSGAPLRLSTREIAEVMIELYWRQTMPFPVAGGATRVLAQNTGRQAGIVNILERERARHGGSLQRVRQDSVKWDVIVGEVESIVRKMPLWKLQTIGGQTIEFLYPNIGRGRSVELYPGVATALRAFHELIVELVRASWLRYIRRYNASALGETSELNAFLFGSERAALQTYRGILEDLQGGACFYCAGALGSVVAVDHFIPWTRYPVDLGHNFVLAHSGCNRSKSDYLAAELHLSAWLVRNRELRGELAWRFDRDGIVHDLPSSIQVAHWAYSQQAATHGRLWVRNKTMAPITSQWPALFLGN